MATNEILPFAQGVGANVQNQASYTAEPLRSSGNVAGIARSNVNNKALRQASVIAAGIAQFMADRQANNITDSATPANISAWMDLAVRSLSSTDFLNTARIDVASASTINLTTAAPGTRHINITGTTTITAFTVAAGQLYFVRFAGVLTLTNNAGIVTQRGANITTAAGDTCVLRATAANVVEVLYYTPGAVTGTGSNVLSASPALTGTPTAPTVPQFDNDTSLATTAFVQQALGNYQGVVAITASGALSVADAGKVHIYSAAPSSFNVTLPALSGLPIGAAYHFHNNSTYNQTLTGSGSDLIGSGQINVTNTYVIPPGCSATLTKNTGGWIVSAGTSSLDKAAIFASSLSANGYQNLPSGLIIQWGKNTVSADSSLNVTLPVAFSVSGFSATTAFAQAGDYNDSCGAFFSSTSILVLTNASNAARAVHWMAIGQ